MYYNDFKNTCWYSLMRLKFGSLSLFEELKERIFFSKKKQTSTPVFCERTAQWFIQSRGWPSTFGSNGWEEDCKWHCV